MRSLASSGASVPAPDPTGPWSNLDVIRATTGRSAAVAHALEALLFSRALPELAADPDGPPSLDSLPRHRLVSLTNRLVAEFPHLGAGGDDE